MSLRATETTRTATTTLLIVTDGGPTDDDSTVGSKKKNIKTITYGDHRPHTVTGADELLSTYRSTPIKH